MTKIFIDPGHGGSDPGAVGNDLQEKEIVLTIAQHIRDMLEDYSDVEVNMSREDDRFVSLSERAQMANEWEADYFISIHSNSGGGHGFESYVHSSEPEKTVELQEIVHSAIINKLEVYDRGKQSANFAVLRETTMPAILTENLFVDNRQDAERLSDPDYLRVIARGHVQGLEQAFELENSNGNSNTTDLYRVIINGSQIGAYENPDNIIREVEQNLGRANDILIERV